VKRITRKRTASRSRTSAASQSGPVRASEAARGRVRVAPEFLVYMKKIDRFRAGREPIALMRTGPRKIARAVAGLNSAQLRRRPAPGKWSIAEILGHLVDTEVVYGYRYRMALSQPGMPIQAYDQATWTEALRHRRRDARRSLAQIQFLRAVNLDLLTSVPRSDWKRYGWHSERGKETVRRTVELIAGHDLNHLGQILAIRDKYGW